MANDPKILFATRANTLRVAAEDIQAFAARPKCVADMRSWNKVKDDTCYACQAGVVAIQSLGVPHDKDIFKNVPFWVESIFRTLDDLHRGVLYNFLRGYCNVIWPIITSERCAEVLEMYGVSRNRNDVRRDLIDWIREDYVPYEKSPEKYIDWLHSVANVLDDLEK